MSGMKTSTNFGLYAHHNYNGNVQYLSPFLNDDEKNMVGYSKFATKTLEVGARSEAREIKSPARAKRDPERRTKEPFSTLKDKKEDVKNERNL